MANEHSQHEAPKGKHSGDHDLEVDERLEQAAADDAPHIAEEDEDLPVRSASGEDEDADPVKDHDLVVEELKDEVQEARDKHLRLLAEFENFRRRSAKEAVTLRQTAARDLISDLLPVLDDFDRALKAMDGNTEHEVDSEGFRLIAEKFRGILERRSLQPMDCLGQPFDPEQHEAITEIPAPDKAQKGTVLDVIEEGYRLGETIIRHAKVVVGK